MLQTLDVISVNIWNIIISLANLTILFLLVKKFLFKPVKNILDKRQSEIDDRYNLADEKEKNASHNQKLWKEKIQTVQSEADAIISDAKNIARESEEKIISEARIRAQGIIRQAETDAELEYKKAVDGIKEEIVNVSEVIAEKLLEREINTDDHRNLIDSYIEKIGDIDE